MFTKILIANRGEIACRIIATCRRLGITSVAVYSEADAQARHVKLADEAWCVGPAASRESYLRADHILDVAKRSGAQAVHPGYGFLSENADFAEACAAAGIVFIGPPVASIRAMGSKSAAKSLMEKADVPLVPGYHGDRQEPEFLATESARIGYPVLIKAAAGGGGKGMRVVEKAEDFAASLASCQREARSSFGDERVLVEKFLIQPRHIEIQVFGDSHGNVINLHERDCSSQRRHQKVIEEAPAPGMSADRRAAMGRAACDAAKAVGYVGAGTVEFIANRSGQFYFMEMNTRLQVEHPVTEMITGLDLVEWQLRVASGEPLPLSQEQVPLNGHAIEVRIYAEDPDKGFLPSIGPLLRFGPPTESDHVRVDTGVVQGDQVTPYYDPMLAKLIVWDASRERAIQRMLLALGQFRIAGVGNNIAFLSRLVGSEWFRQGTMDTGLIERERAVLIPPPASLPSQIWAIAALWTLKQEQDRLSQDQSPWNSSDGWRLNSKLSRQLEFISGEQTQKVQLEYRGTELHLSCEDFSGIVSLQNNSGDGYSVRYGAEVFGAEIVNLDEDFVIFAMGQSYKLHHADPLLHAGEEQEAHGGLTAPMPGKIVALLAEIGKPVEKGAPLLVMEAMKMEHTLCASSAGTVKSFSAAVGEQVKEGAVLVDFEVAVA